MMNLVKDCQLIVRNLPDRNVIEYLTACTGCLTEILVPVSHRLVAFKLLSLDIKLRTEPLLWNRSVIAVMDDRVLSRQKHVLVNPIVDTLRRVP